MKVTNNTEEILIAFIWDERFGFGKDTAIHPGSTTEVEGVYIGEMGNGSCTISPEKDVVCQSTPDDGYGFFVDKEKPLHLKTGKQGVTVRHFSTPREPHTK
ncbi:MAG TPA: hypothetical protein PLQ20_01185 [Candidatus Paceibacterota bacterium]|nr:hypothetical protein [Candidatus Paceibacterota bacterium]